MAERAIFLDRDNTIIADEGYLGDPAKVKLLPGAGAALQAMHRFGYRIIVASNQSGVARGLFDEKAVEAVNQEMVRQLKQQAGAHVDASYYCPYHPEATIPEYRVDHEWRKPRPGMLKAAAEDFNLDLSQCWMIGDMVRDIAAGAAVGCRTILLADPEKPLPTDKDSPTVTPNFVVRTLADAARIVVREGNSSVRDPVPAPLNAKPAAGTAAAVAAEVQKHVEPVTTEPTAGEPTLSAAKPLAVSSAVPAAAPKVTPASVPAATPVVPPAAAPAAPPAAAPVIDSTLIASAVAQAVSTAIKEHLANMTPPVAPLAPIPAPPVAQDSHTPVLEEMLQQLRQFNRRQDLHGFSLSLLLASILQMVVLLFLAMAVWDTLTALQVIANNINWWFNKTSDQLFALAWLVAALVVQGTVLTLYVRYRNK